MEEMLDNIRTTRKKVQSECKKEISYMKSMSEHTGLMMVDAILFLAEIELLRQENDGAK